jgi:hypothetical protein
VSIAAFARELDVDEKAVRKAIASHRIPPTCVGLSSTGRRQVITDPAAARIAWAENAAKIPRGPDVAGGARESLSEAARVATLERGRKLRMENDLREGRLVELRIVQREAFESARIIREALLNVPVRIAAELAAETDPARIFAILEDAIREALANTADRLEAAGE